MLKEAYDVIFNMVKWNRNWICFKNTTIVNILQIPFQLFLMSYNFIIKLCIFTVKNQMQSL